MCIAPPNRARPGPATLLLLLAPILAAATGSVRDTQAELAGLRERVRQVSEQVSRDAVERDRLAGALRGTELAVSSARADLERVRAEESGHTAKRAALALERSQVALSLQHERAALAAQLRVAWQLGRHEPLELLLNQRDPAAAERLYAWYGYFGRARADQIAGITRQLQHLDELDAALAAEARALADLASRREQQLKAVDAARAQRAQALAQLEQDARSREASLKRLRSQQADLERLLRELTRAARTGPPADFGGAFGRLRGQLDWPVEGHVVARYGERRATGVNWQGMVVGTRQGAPVRAVAAGRVIYADWLPGLGLLSILDHGDGYMSLYGYNDQLRHATGDTVAAGEVIAAAGDSGGRPEPQLYFEIRRQGQPVDPRPWFRRAAP